MKAISRTTDMHVLEKSDCAVVPVNLPNKGRQLPAEAGEGRARLEENIVRRTCSRHRAGKACPSVWTVCVADRSLGSLHAIILQKSRMRKSARTDLCGGRSVRIVPTATGTRQIGWVFY